MDRKCKIVILSRIASVRTLFEQSSPFGENKYRHRWITGFPLFRFAGLRHFGLLQSSPRFPSAALHIQKSCSVVAVVITVSREPAIRSHMKATGHGSAPINGPLPLAAFHPAEMLQADVQHFGYFLPGHSPGLAEHS